MAAMKLRGVAMRNSGMVMLLAMACGVMGGCGRSEQPAAPMAAPKPAQAAAPPPPAPAALRKEPETLEILSAISVEQEVEIRGRRRGAVRELLAEQGSTVAKGAVLARLDDRELQADLEKARAGLAVAQSNVKYNEAELQAREAAYKRAQEMRKAGLNSDADLEEAEFRAKGAAFDLESWRAVVLRETAEIRRLELQLEKTQIRAPFAGVVTQRYIRLGEDVLEDSRCFRLSQLAPLLVKFQVPESAGRAPQLGASVTLVTQAEPQRKLTARITRMSPVVDAASGSYDVTAELSAGNTAGLRPGMAVRVLWPARAASGARE